MNTNEDSDDDVEDEPDNAPEIQIQTAKKHYENLYRVSIAKVVLYSIPALIFTIASVFLYVKSEEGFFVNGMTYNAPNYLTVIIVAAAIICWGLFFWLKVRSSHKQAELWRKSMESYEALVLSESQLKTKEEKAEASRRSLRQGQRAVIRKSHKKLKPVL